MFQPDLLFPATE